MRFVCDICEIFTMVWALWDFEFGAIGRFYCDGGFAVIITAMAYLEKAMVWNLRACLDRWNQIQSGFYANHSAGLKLDKVRKCHNTTWVAENIEHFVVILIQLVYIKVNSYCTYRLTFLALMSICYICNTLWIYTCTSPWLSSKSQFNFCPPSVGEYLFNFHGVDP